jgi:hypothetical protein
VAAHKAVGASTVAVDTETTSRRDDEKLAAPVNTLKENRVSPMAAKAGLPPGQDNRRWRSSWTPRRHFIVPDGGGCWAALYEGWRRGETPMAGQKVVEAFQVARDAVAQQRRSDKALEVPMAIQKVDEAGPQWQWSLECPL